MESLLVHSTRMQIAGNNNYWTFFSLQRTRLRRAPTPIRHHPLRCRTDRHRPCWLERSVANSAGQQAPHTRSKYTHRPQENSGPLFDGILGTLSIDSILAPQRGDHKQNMITSSFRFGITLRPLRPLLSLPEMQNTSRQLPCSAY